MTRRISPHILPVSSDAPKPRNKHAGAVSLNEPINKCPFALKEQVNVWMRLSVLQSVWQKSSIIKRRVTTKDSIPSKQSPPCYLNEHALHSGTSDKSNVALDRFFDLLFLKTQVDLADLAML